MIVVSLVPLFPEVDVNLVLLLPEDWLDGSTVRLHGRRFRHVVEVHRVALGGELKVGALGGRMGTGRITCLEEGDLRMAVTLTEEAPPKVPLVLVLALPRPKVLNRVLASATSLGVQSIHLVNAWKVEKGYWKSPRMSEANLLHQRILGLEQAKDTHLPELQLHRLFRPFVENVLPGLLDGRSGILAHPRLPQAQALAERNALPAVAAIGPEGGWIDAEVESFLDAGFAAMGFGPRILRVETALPYLMGWLA